MHFLYRKVGRPLLRGTGTEMSDHAFSCSSLLTPGSTAMEYSLNSSFAFVVVTGKVFTWGRADYGQLGRTVETREGWQSEKRDPSLPGSGPQKGTPSCLPCLTGATEVGSDLFPQG